MYIQTPTERQFDWDEVKRWSTLEKHGIDFIDAALVFDQEHLILNSGHWQNEFLLLTERRSGHYIIM